MIHWEVYHLLENHLPGIHLEAFHLLVVDLKVYLRPALRLLETHLEVCHLLEIHLKAIHQMVLWYHSMELVFMTEWKKEVIILEVSIIHHQQLG